MLRFDLPPTRVRGTARGIRNLSVIGFDVRADAVYSAIVCSKSIRLDKDFKKFSLMHRPQRLSVKANEARAINALRA